jgi:hypothetical protein
MLPGVMGVLRLLGGLVGITALLSLLVIAICAAMWVVLLAVRHVPVVGRRHRHARWSEMQRQGTHLRPPTTQAR